MTHGKGNPIKKTRKIGKRKKQIASSRTKSPRRLPSGVNIRAGRAPDDSTNVSPRKKTRKPRKSRNPSKIIPKTFRQLRRKNRSRR